LQFRLRGYKTGSLFIGPEDKEQYWKQPGHALYEPKEGEREYTEEELQNIEITEKDAHPNILADVQRLPGVSLKDQQVERVQLYDPAKIVTKVVRVDPSVKMHSHPSEESADPEERARQRALKRDMGPGVKFDDWEEEQKQFEAVNKQLEAEASQYGKNQIK
jgi:hypothetical protein